MKTLERILSKTLAPCLAMTMANPFAHTQEAPKKEDINPFYPIRLGLNIECSGSSYQTTIPESHIPKTEGSYARTPGDVKTSTHGTRFLTFGPKIELLSFAEASIQYNTSFGFSTCNNRTTFWGSYAQGNYACIGEVYNKSKPFVYELTLKTPKMSLSKDINMSLFSSYLRSDFKSYFRSGYHKYGKPYYGGTIEDFKIADAKEETIRLGAKFGIYKGDKFTFSLFCERNRLNFSPTSEGKDFRLSNKNWGAGIAMEYFFGE